MRFLLRLTGGNPRDEMLTAIRSLARSVGAEARNPKWTSGGSLEIDVFSPTRADYDLFLAAVSPLYEIEFSHDLNMAPPHHADEEVIIEARSYFDSERFWECHETLEGLWRVKSGEEKQFLQGLILLCAAFVHHQKGEETVARSVLGRALPKLEFSLPQYHGLDTAAIGRAARRIASDGIFVPFPLPEHG